ncbi:MAG: hypothetical protein JW927_22945 [Deltaproteobacteria bacterium]|nr:hypothetical protein [Deltaproteobacteria bacterium]
MNKYISKWMDYTLPTGQHFSVSVCGYSGKVRHLYLGDDPVRRMLVQHVYADDGFCQTGDHCLALDCPLNRADREHLLHMLDMNEDEELDKEAAKEWGTGSTLEGFLLFVKKIGESLPDDVKRPRSPVEEENQPV